MTDYAYLVLSCLFSVEIFTRLKFKHHSISILRNTIKVFKIILSSNISDHWKEKMVPAYALIILRKSLIIMGILLLIILVFSFFIFISNNFLSLLFSLIGIVISFLISFTYYKFRIIVNE